MLQSLDLFTVIRGNFTGSVIILELEQCQDKEPMGCVRWLRNNWGNWATRPSLRRRQEIIDLELILQFTYIEEFFNFIGLSFSVSAESTWELNDFS